MTDSDDDVLRLDLADGSVCLVERKQADRLVMVARQVDGEVVWGQVFSTADPDGPDWEADTVAAMQAHPETFVVEPVVEEVETTLTVGYVDDDGEFRAVPDFSPRLIVDRDDLGRATSAVGVSPGGRPFAVEWVDDGVTVPLYDQLSDLGFDGPTIEAAYASAQTTYVMVGDHLLDPEVK